MKVATLALCIPAYKAEKCLPQLLESARAQEPAFDEVIVCVDASPDATAAVARAFGATVIVNEKNLGCSSSKNRALRASTADWVHFHDADDILLPGFTAEAHRWMARPDAPDVVIMGFEYRDFESNQLLDVGLVDDAALAGNPVNFSILHKLPNFGIYHRETLLKLGGFEEDRRFLYAEDYAFHVSLALNGARFRASQEITSINWRHHNSMSSANQAKCHASVLAIIEKLSGITHVKDHPQVREFLCQQAWRSARALTVYRSGYRPASEAIRLASRFEPDIPSTEHPILRILVAMFGPNLAFAVYYNAYPSLRWMADSGKKLRLAFRS
jgi:glycosyltransferase involved in cell wall biosynthesis